MAPRARPTDWQPGLNMPPDELDSLMELLLSSRPGRADGWLTVSFDDGYQDSAEYIRTRAPRFPDVEFIFFVCPEKLERRVGFRWDLAEEAMIAGQPADRASALCDAPVVAGVENTRQELTALAALPQYRLATVAETLELTQLPNVKLGNHTNLHVSANKHPDALIREDYRSSSETFARLFGRQTQFAFPFGTPAHHFAPRHVAMLRELGDFTIWTTEARPYLPHERAQGLVPRFPVNGSKTARELAGWIAARSLDFRVRGRKKI